METDLRETFDTTTYSFVDCRDMGHQWGKTRTFETPGEYMVVHGTLRLTRRRTCTACGTDRDQLYVVDKLSGSLHQLATSYAYAEGYRLKGHDMHEVMASCRFQNLLTEFEANRG